MKLHRGDALSALVFGGLVALFLAATGCATTGKWPGCNPQMVRCNPADYPPLTALLPKSPIRPPLSDWTASIADEEGDR